MRAMVAVAAMCSGAVVPECEPLPPKWEGNRSFGKGRLRDTDKQRNSTTVGRRAERKRQRQAKKRGRA